MGKIYQRLTMSLVFLCIFTNHTVSSLSMGDPRNVLNSLKSSTIDNVPQNVVESWYDDKENNEEQFQIGEAVACIWQEDVGYDITWYLGIVDQTVGDEVYVSYIRKSDKQGLSWLFPDEAEIHDMSQDKIITRIIEIRYSMTAVIRANILKHTLNRLNSVLRKFQHDWSRYWFQGWCILTCFSPVLWCYTPWKHQKN